MALDPATRLGRYEILGLLGAGGMGEVYRARDTELDRDVAVKVLPSDVAEDPEALARFQQEARAVAALAHPNILSIYDFGIHEGRAYAAMELLEGQTLRTRLGRGRLPLDEAVEVASQLAMALAAVHERGIVHRDIKPDNLFLTRDGGLKVLDFGLARKPALPTGGGSDSHLPTRPLLTDPGTVIGTVGYMAPEQVRGETVDARADLFSLGCVTWEMLTGRNPFERASAPETLTAILRDDPDPIETPSGAAPLALSRILRRCLEKTPQQRFHSASDLAFALSTCTDRARTGAERSDRVPSQPPSRAAWGAAATGGALLLLGLFLGRVWRPVDIAPGPAEPVRVGFLTVSGSDSKPTASPDGQLIAFTSARDGAPRIWIKQLTGGGEAPLTDGPDTLPQFSPDGSSLLFLRQEGQVLSVFRQALVGGQPRKLVENASEAVWSPDGQRIAFLRTISGEIGPVSYLGLADAQEGQERPLARAAERLFGLRWSPDGRILSAAEDSQTGTAFNAKLVLISTDTGQIRRMRPAGDGKPISVPAWNHDGQLIYAFSDSIVGDQGGTLSSFVLHDLESDRWRRLFWVQGLFPRRGPEIGASRIEVLGEGVAVFDRTLMWQQLRESGLSSPGDGHRLTRGEGSDRQPAYSPDGSLVLFSSNRSGNLDLWTMDLATGVLRQLTDDPAQDWDPAFTPDGDHLIWSSDRSGRLEIWTARADGSQARQLSHQALDAQNPSVTPDGSWVMYWSAHPDNIGIWKMRSDGSDATPLLLGTGAFSEVSPDGRYLAYVTLELQKRRNVIRVLEIETGEPLVFEISVNLPLRAPNIVYGRCRWLPDGGGLAFVATDDDNLTGVFAQDFEPGVDTTSTRRAIAGFSPDFVTESFALSPDGKRITISALERSQQLMLAEGVAGLSRPP